jgi:hypothetical protein
MVSHEIFAQGAFQMWSSTSQVVCCNNNKTSFCLSSFAECLPLINYFKSLKLCRTGWTWVHQDGPFLYAAWPRGVCSLPFSLVHQQICHGEPASPWQPLLWLLVHERFPWDKNDRAPTSSSHIWESPKYITYSKEQCHLNDPRTLVLSILEIFWGIGCTQPCQRMAGKYCFPTVSWFVPVHAGGKQSVARESFVWRKGSS